MQDYIYSAAAFSAILIHLIINSDLHFGRRVIDARGVREYRAFLTGIFAYYIVDAGWGVFAGLGWTKVLYVDTMFYYIAIAVSALTWCHFVAVYLDLSKWKARALSWFGSALLGLYVVLLDARLVVLGNLVDAVIVEDHAVGPGPLIGAVMRVDVDEALVDEHVRELDTRLYTPVAELQRTCLVRLIDADNVTTNAILRLINLMNDSCRHIKFITFSFHVNI